MNSFSLENVREIANGIVSSNTINFEELPRYDLFLSQVIDFLNDKFDDEKFTGNIIQNYIKSGVISKPEDGKKRGYTKQHLVQLVLMSYMRPILTTDEIKKVFKLAFNDINDRTDDIISWEKAYEIFSKIQSDAFDNFLGRQNFQDEKLEKLIAEFNLESKDHDRIMEFLVVLTLISQASAIKKLAQKIVDSNQ
jgi:hypothetical protein